MFAGTKAVLMLPYRPMMWKTRHLLLTTANAWLAVAAKSRSAKAAKSCCDKKSTDSPISTVS